MGLSHVLQVASVIGWFLSQGSPADKRQEVCLFSIFTFHANHRIFPPLQFFVREVLLVFFAIEWHLLISPSYANTRFNIPRTCTGPCLPMACIVVPPQNGSYVHRYPGSAIASVNRMISCIASMSVGMYQSWLMVKVEREAPTREESASTVKLKHSGTSLKPVLGVEPRPETRALAAQRACTSVSHHWQYVRAISPVKGAISLRLPRVSVVHPGVSRPLARAEAPHPKVETKGVVSIRQLFRAYPGPWACALFLHRLSTQASFSITSFRLGSKPVSVLMLSRLPA